MNTSLAFALDRTVLLSTQHLHLATLVHRGEDSPSRYTDMNLRVCEMTLARKEAQAVRSCRVTATARVTSVLSSNKTRGGVGTVLHDSASDSLAYLYSPQGAVVVLAGKRAGMSGSPHFLASARQADCTVLSLVDISLHTFSAPIATFAPGVSCRSVSMGPGLAAWVDASTIVCRPLDRVDDATATLRIAETRHASPEVAFLEDCPSLVCTYADMWLQAFDVRQAAGPVLVRSCDTPGVHTRRSTLLRARTHGQVILMHSAAPDLHAVLQVDLRAMGPCHVYGGVLADQVPVYDPDEHVLCHPSSAERMALAPLADPLAFDSIPMI